MGAYRELRKLPRGVSIARKGADELNAYDEEVQKVGGIFAPHLGSDNVHVTRTTQWRIVAKAVDVDLNLLTLKSGSAATRSPVNNCGKSKTGDDSIITPTTSNHAEAVLNLVDSRVLAWDDQEVVTVLWDALKNDSTQPIKKQRSQ